MSLVFEATIKVPSAVSALSLGHDDVLCVGSYDGSIRWYNLPSGKVSRAVKSLGEEISSIVWSHTKKETPASVWIASGRKALCLPVDSHKLILSVEDAMVILEVGEDEEDVLNELSLSENGKHLAFGSDSGSIGIIELSSRRISRMRTTHTTVCGCVTFVPDRPNELLSGGYDSALLHFDVTQGTTLSRYDIAGTPPNQGISLSPPFVLSTSISTTGLLAAGTADGRVWLGGGGEKRANAPQGAKKKRSRKWEGLKEDEGMWLQVADGPVVSIAFRNSGHLIACSLLGTISAYDISRDNHGELQAMKVWSEATRSVEKVNAMAVSRSWVIIGGFGKDGKGVVETWRALQGHASQPVS